MLIRHLPQDSWTQTILRDEKKTEFISPVSPDEQQFGPWATLNYQMAALTDAVRHLEYVLARVNGNEKYPAPEPTPRPGLKRPVAKQSQAAVLYLDKLRARG